VATNHLPGPSAHHLSPFQAEKKHVAKLLETASMAEKIFKLDE
jgi:hypothetical protein